MKKYYLGIALLAVMMGQVHAAQVVERSRDNRRMAQLRYTGPDSGASQNAARRGTSNNVPVGGAANNQSQVRRK